MKIVQADEMDMHGGTTYRAGTSQHKVLLEGIPGRLDNFSLVMAASPGRYSPRHRHNFEQVRFQLEGEANYGETGKLSTGMVGYYPEAVHYGPQTQEEGSFVASLVLQCGGASGCGYVSRGESREAVKALEEIGSFEKGAFKMPKSMKGLPGGTQGKRNLDGAQAIWEYVNKKPMTYPEPRYGKPILLDPENYRWVVIPDQPGVSERKLGSFTEAGTALRLVKVDAGATYTATGGRDIFFIHKGVGTAEGEKLRFSTTIYLDPGENVAIRAGEEITILNMHLPDLGYLEAQDAGAQAAAE